MKLCIALCVVVLSVALAGSSVGAVCESVGKKSTGGDEYKLATAPFYVSLQVQGYHYCSGSIIDPNFVITAAACCVGLSSPDFVRIVAGLTKLSHPDGDIQVIRAARTIIFPDYDPASLRGYICVVELEKPLIISSQRRTAAMELPPVGYLASGHANITQWEEGGDGEVSVVQVTVPIVPDTDCREKYESVHVNIVDEVICAGEKGRSPNFQNIGGPLADSEGFLVGILISGYGGEESDYPDIHAEVSYLTQWVKAILANNSEHQLSAADVLKHKAT